MHTPTSERYGLIALLWCATSCLPSERRQEQNSFSTVAPNTGVFDFLLSTFLLTAAMLHERRQLRYNWGSQWRGGRRPTDDAGRTAVGAGGGGFLTPSTLQEASLWSTAVEQANLEHRMKEVRSLCFIRTASTATI